MHRLAPQRGENIVIQGDNLEALKAILPVYAGKVKCIYIDPPYNTGNAFEHYDDNREHTMWLSMIYPRLALLREFLREDGVIFINIDETEHAYLVVIMDEIFGRANFLGDLIWKKRKGGGNDSQFFALDHDYILVYAKNSSKEMHPNKWRVSQSNEYLKRYKEIDENGNRFYWDTVNRDGLQNPIPVELTCPDGSKLNVNSQLSEKSILDGIRNGNVRLKKVKDKWMLHHRVTLNPEGQVLRSILPEYATNKTAGEEQKSLNLHIDGFDYPKPEALIKVLLELATKPGDIVLDSFLGSGTTAAVALKMNRKFIGIEMGDHAVTHVVPRLRKVIEGEQGGISESVGWKGGGSFDFYTLGETIFGTDGRINPKID